MELIQPQQLELAVEAIEAGQLVVVPTRRWYMICANAADTTACDRIFAAKQRPTSKSLVYVLPNPAAAGLFVMTPEAEALAAAFWPGDLALVLPWRDESVGYQHAAVGVPNALVTHDSGVLGDLAARSRVPIAATTVNISNGGTYETGPAISTGEVARFAAESGVDIAYCVDGGVSPFANHLTIVDCTTTTAKLIRPGLIHERAINMVIKGNVSVCPGPLPDTQRSST